MLRTLRKTAASSLLALCATTAVADNTPFAFAVLGDGPYGEAAEPKYANMIADINRDRSVAFSLHVGDVKGGGEMCTDELLQRRFELFQQLNRPFVLTPGDNDWTDCHRANNGGYLPTERLQFLRQLFYPNPLFTTGHNKMRVRPQSYNPGFEEFVENTYFPYNGVIFTQVHVVGSNNNLAPWNQIDPTDSAGNPRLDRLEEYSRRNAANLAWLAEAFDFASKHEAKGMVVSMQADPRFDLPASNPARAGFNDFLEALLKHVRAFGKPVLLIHGDSHVYFVDQPRFVPWYANPDSTSEADNVKIPNLTRMETFGDTENHWIRIEVVPGSKDLFRIFTRVVAANL